MAKIYTICINLTITQMQSRTQSMGRITEVMGNILCKQHNLVNFTKTIILLKMVT